MADHDTFARLEITSEAALLAWLSAHHGQELPVWLVTYKAAAQDKYVSRDQVLDALLAYGWVDGRRKVLDTARTMQLIAPRRTDDWTETYRARAARLIAAGKMQPPGAAAIARAKRSGGWAANPDVDALQIPSDLRQALDARPNAAAVFDAAAPSYRRNVLRWIAKARTAPTRAKRLTAVAEHAARGEKVPQM